MFVGCEMCFGGELSVVVVVGKLSFVVVGFPGVLVVWDWIVLKSWG